MQIIYYGKNDDEMQIIPVFQIYLHKHSNISKEFKWHFHICFSWIMWYFEIQIGEEYKEE